MIFVIFGSFLLHPLLQFCGCSSDDEGSTAATDGSTLRTSPAEAAGSAGSESGGSGADSIGGVSGRSSAYGNHNLCISPRDQSVSVAVRQSR